MKRILTLAAFALSLITAAGQKGLNIGIYFSDHYKDLTAASVYIEGSDLSPYNLSLFRSITLTAETTPQKSWLLLEQRVVADANLATKKEVAMIGTRLYYGFYALPPLDGETNRYIFYRNNLLKPEAKPQEIMLVYIEGKASSAELKKIFK
jgi:hypothetical protein